MEAGWLELRPTVSWQEGIACKPYAPFFPYPDWSKFKLTLGGLAWNTAVLGNFLIQLLCPCDLEDIWKEGDI